MKKSYTSTITDYGYKKRVTTYSRDIQYDVPNTTESRLSYKDMNDLQKEYSDKRRINYYKKAIAELIEIAMMNDDLNIAITLTFREPVTSYDYAVAEWQLFLKRLRHVVKEPLKYICVWEYQKNRSQNLGMEHGGVFHFHCLMNLGYIDHGALEKLWGKGFVWGDKLSTENKRHSAIRYTMKYIVKEVVSRIESKEDIRGQRFYFTSNNLLKPKITRLPERVNIQDAIFEHMEEIIADASYNVINEYGEIVNHVDYVEYKER